MSIGGSSWDMRLPAGGRRRRGNFFIELLQTVLLALLLYGGVSLATDRVRVENISMQPTLYEDHLLLVNKLVYKVRQPTYGEVIIFHHTDNPPEDYVKRVIGLPGDEVWVKDGRVYVNGVRLNEPYIKEAPNYEDRWIVPEDHYFMLGDNRNNSSDSHIWGFVHRDKIIGRADFIYWPLQRAGSLLPPDTVLAAP